mmetsp:Transcript_54880/g.174427  ORF Transcript_54880/g.174427 Transcript_54880/m.174427 type:complete len:110 (+) Transcript_54880:417-746(+)
MFLPWYGMLALVLCGLCCLVSSYKCYKWRRRRRLHAALYGGSQRYQEAVALKKESIFKKMFTRSSRKYKKKDHLSQDARLKLARYKAEKNKSALERMWDTRVNKYRDGG